MPTRMLKESICTSENLNALSTNAEILFYRLMVNADDFGRYFGHPGIVKGHCFPLREEDIDSKDVSTWLHELETAGLIMLYSVNGRQYIQFCKWDKHQKRRALESKFPAPVEPCEQVQTDVDTCEQVQTDDSKCARIRSRIRNSYSDANNVCEEDEKQDDGFEAFWAAFPKKSGDIRQAYFEYLGVVQDGTSPETLLEAVKWQAEAKEQRYFPSAEKWLRNKGWTEEKPKDTAPKRSPGFATSGGPQKPLTSDQWDKVLDRI